MTGQIDKIVHVYRTLAKIPAIVGGVLNSNGTKITSRWSVRNLDKGKNTQYVVDYVLDSDLKVIAESDFGLDVSNELLSAVSPNETFKAIIREEKNGKEKKKCFLEVWSRSSLAHSIDLTALDVHGDVYADDEFGSLDWSTDEKSLIYIAEQKAKESESFIKRKPVDADTVESGNEKVTPGGEYIYKPDWGEQLVGKKQSVIVKCDLDSEAVTVLQGVPEALCPGQVRFSPDGKSVVGVAWEARGIQRLGLIFCTNRVSQIFSLSLDGNYKRLSQPGMSVRSPRFTRDGALVWLQRTSGGPHDACHQLVRLDKDSIESMTERSDAGVQESVLLDVVDTSIKITNGDFYGLFAHKLPGQCLSGDGQRLVFNSVSQVQVDCYVLDIESGQITNISPGKAGSCSVLCVRSDVVLATFSNITTPGQLLIAKLPPAGMEHAIQWVAVSEPASVPKELSESRVEYMFLNHSGEDDVKSFSAIYASGAAPGGALVVWPHGGPHSAFVNAYALETAMFNLLGFSTLRLNFRGSTGNGQGHVYSLIGRIGSYDVRDCLLAIRALNEDKIVLYGGSYGGYLCAQMAGLCPGMFEAMVLRNPLIDLATKVNYADNPDGCYVEAGLPYAPSGPASEQDLLAMRRCSPLAHVHKVKAPTALMLGSGDKRVPCYQGLEYAKRLHANGVEHRVFMYDDNHSLRSLTSEVDNLINGMDWFLTHLKD